MVRKSSWKILKKEKDLTSEQRRNNGELKKARLPPLKDFTKDELMQIVGLIGRKKGVSK